MSTRYKPDGQNEAEFEKSVAKYLRDHPDFFEQRTDLLADMTLPHESGGAVSLIERQVAVLRDQKAELKRKLQQLMQHARSNEQLSVRFQALVLDLMDAVTLDDLLATIQSRMITDFDADAVVVRLFHSADAAAGSALTQRPEFADWSEPVLGAFEKIVSTRKPVCGHLKHGQLDSLFADQSEQIASVALVPLVEGDGSKACYGMLAIGSRDPQRFNPEMGTMFLEYLSNVLSRVLKPYLSG